MVTKEGWPVNSFVNVNKQRERTVYGTTKDKDKEWRPVIFWWDKAWLWADKKS